AAVNGRSPWRAPAHRGPAPVAADPAAPGWRIVAAMTSLRRRSFLGLAALPLATACSPLALLNATVPDGGYRLLADQAYGPHPRQRLDLYLPDDLARPAPVALFFYGGR